MQLRTTSVCANYQTKKPSASQRMASSIVLFLMPPFYDRP